MILHTQKIKKYFSIVSNVRVKGDFVCGNIFLDFEENKLWFKNTTGIIGYLKFDSTIDEGEKVKNILIPSDKFGFIVSLSDTIEVNSEGTFLVNGGKYDLSIYGDSMDLPDFSNSTEISKFILSPESILLIEEATNYMASGMTVDTALAGVFIRDSRIIGSNRYKLFDYKLEGIQNDYEIPASIANIIKSVSKISGIEELAVSLTKYESNFLKLKVGDDLVIYSTEQYNLSLPDIDAPDFVKLFNHETKLILDRQDLVNVLQRISIFYKSLGNQKIRITCIDDSNIEVSVLATSDTPDFKQATEILSNVDYRPSYEKFADLSINISGGSLLTAINYMESEKIKLAVGVDSDTGPISVIDNEKFHVILTKIIG